MFKIKTNQMMIIFFRIFISLCNKFLKTKQKHKQTNKQNQGQVQDRY